VEFGGLSDELRFSLKAENERALIWWERETNNYSTLVHEKSQYDGGGCMVCAPPLSVGNVTTCKSFGMVG